GKDRGVGADTQRQRGDRHQCEPGIANERANRVSHRVRSISPLYALCRAPVPRLTRYPTPKQITVPAATYQVQASVVANEMTNIDAAETAIPASAPVVFARFVSTPRQNAPSTGPV